MSVNRYHCCATCKHFQVIKESSRTYHKCERLGYETKSTYRFNCWNPKEHVKKLIEKEARNTSG
ncbi:hypothetical protein FCL54_06235 [Pseudalkalibacillus caeni]|uniref:Uncharacterized protein n=1 Tax=Exobacillus caeni TaxID=2574798 RepID=A0A5R9FEY4_9BACL|nr:hypothetical protein [Pseudalkalibacillus caeni]TLS38135.1 hypothetical protein FCL54_06235 [Pseudalkalibacillus caeni]